MRVSYHGDWYGLFFERALFATFRLLFLKYANPAPLRPNVFAPSEARKRTLTSTARRYSETFSLCTPSTIIIIIIVRRRRRHHYHHHHYHHQSVQLILRYCARPRDI